MLVKLTPGAENSDAIIYDFFRQCYSRNPNEVFWGIVEIRSKTYSLATVFQINEYGYTNGYTM